MEPKPEEQLSPELREKYSHERMRQYLKKEITGKEFHQLSDAQVLKMAMMGFQQYEQGRYPEAQAIFQTLVGLDRKEPYYRIALGAVYLAQDDLEQAEMSFNAAVNLGTTEVAAYVNRGEVYLRTGRVMEAAKDFKRAVELDPKGKDPLTQRARLLAGAALDMVRKAKAEKKAAPAVAGPAAKPGAAPAPKLKPAVAAAAKKK